MSGGYGVSPVQESRWWVRFVLKRKSRNKGYGTTSGTKTVFGRPCQLSPNRVLLNHFSDRCLHIRPPVPLVSPVVVKTSGRCHSDNRGEWISLLPSLGPGLADAPLRRNPSALGVTPNIGRCPLINPTSVLIHGTGPS